LSSSKSSSNTSQCQQILDSTKISKGLEETGDVYHMHTTFTLHFDDSGAIKVTRARGLLGHLPDYTHVSKEAFYMWTAHEFYSMAYRMPHFIDEVSVVRTTGVPVAYDSFYEGAENLSVLIEQTPPALRRPGRSYSDDDYDSGSHSGNDGPVKPRSQEWAMFKKGEVYMANIPIDRFKAGSNCIALTTSYTALEAAAANPDKSGTLISKGVGNFVVYGRDYDSENTLFVADRDNNFSLSRVHLPHGIHQLHAISGGVIVAGSRGNDLYYSSIALEGTPRVVDELVRRDVASFKTTQYQVIAEGRCIDIGFQPITSYPDCKHAATMLELDYSSVDESEDTEPNDPDGCFIDGKDESKSKSKYLRMGINTSKHAGAVHGYWKSKDYEVGVDEAEEVYVVAKKPICKHAYEDGPSVFVDRRSDGADIVAVPLIDVHVLNVTNFRFESLMKLSASIQKDDAAVDFPPRPIFHNGRVFTLFGHELVEGIHTGGVDNQTGAQARLHLADPIDVKSNFTTETTPYFINETTPSEPGDLFMFVKL
jgi:hypothetical protein